MSLEKNFIVKHGDNERKLEMNRREFLTRGAGTLFAAATIAGIDADELKAQESFEPIAELDALTENIKEWSSEAEEIREIVKKAEIMGSSKREQAAGRDIDAGFTNFFQTAIEVMTEHLQKGDLLKPEVEGSIDTLPTHSRCEELGSDSCVEFHNAEMMFSSQYNFMRLQLNLIQEALNEFKTQN